MSQKKWSPEWTTKVVSITQGAQKIVDQTKPLVEIKTKLESEITQLEAKISQETGNYPSFVYLRKWIDNWTNNRGGRNYQTLSDNFHKSGTNQYGFDKKVANWYQKSYGASIAYQNNLYRLTLNSTNYEITEEELLTLMARVVKNQEPRTYEELWDAVSKIINMLQEEDLRKYFRDCLDFDFILKIGH